MPSLLLADLHLTDRPRDEDRWGIFPWAVEQIKRCKVEEVIILGDLTDAKNNHSAALVNRVIENLQSLTKEADVYVLMGNHDYVDRAMPFFKFANKIHDLAAGGRTLQFITTPIGQNLSIGDALLLPNTPNWERDWADIDFSTYDYAFAHQTFSGATSETGYRLIKGVPPTALDGVRKRAYSGDIHTQQPFGKKGEYVGAPYRIRYGDAYTGRAILVGKTPKGKHQQQDLHYPAKEKHVIAVNDIDRLEVFDNVPKGSDVKIRIKVSRADLPMWQETKEKAKAKAIEMGWNPDVVELVRTETLAGDAPKPSLDDNSLDPLIVFNNYCRAKQVPVETVELGRAILAKIGKSFRSEGGGLINLLRIDSENFQGYKGRHRIKLDLSPGLYNLTGRNVDNPRLGANDCGKSTLINMIYWTITGELLTITRPGDDIAHWGSGRRVSCKLWFEIGDRFYSLYRQRGPNTLVLTEEPKGVEEEGRVVEQAEIRELFRLSNKALKCTIMIGQFADMFLDLPAQEQSDFFTEVLSLDAWIEAATEAGASRAESERLQRGIVDAKISNEARAETLEDQIEGTQGSIAEWYDSRRARLGSALADLRTAEGWVRSDAAKLEAAPKPGDIGEAILDKQSEIAAQERWLSTATSEHRNFSQSVAALRRETEVHSYQIDNLQKAQLTRICPECKQQVTFDHFREKIEELSAIREAKLEKAVLEEGSMKDWLNKRDTASLKLESLRDEIAPALREHQEKVRLYNDAVALLDKSERDLGVAKANHDRIQRETNPHEETKRRLEDQLIAAKEAASKNSDDLSKAIGEVEAFKLLETYFKEIRLSLIDQVLLEVEVSANEQGERLGSEGWTIKLSTERELKSGRTSAAFTALLYPPGQDKPVNWQAVGGGVRQRWQLAMTRSLSEVLLVRAGVDFNIEFLDEPTRGTSQEGVAELISHLRDRALDLGKAIVLVDHHVLDRGQFDGVLIAVREKGESRLEVI